MSQKGLKTRPKTPHRILFLSDDRDQIPIQKQSSNYEVPLPNYETYIDSLVIARASLEATTNSVSYQKKSVDYS